MLRKSGILQGHRLSMNMLYGIVIFGLLQLCLSVKPPCRASITREPWGDVYNSVLNRRESITRYTLKNCLHTTVQIISYGASISSIVTPDVFNRLDDVVLGFDDINGYRNPENAFLGATIGRVANRIAKGRFTLTSNGQQKVYNLDKNDGQNTLHGGFNSFGKVVWQECPNSGGNSVTLCYSSPQGDGGFPGEVQASVKYTLNDSNALIMEYKATVQKEATPISMTNHAYFNLAGQSAGATELHRHVVKINADAYTPLNNESIPTGVIADVKGTEFDLRQWTTLDEALKNTANNGYDINFAVSCSASTLAKGLCQAAQIFHPQTKRLLSVWTTQPGLQFYTANGLNARGKNKVLYDKHSAFCLEAQQFPDAVNHPQFPNTIVKPGESYTATTIYKFDFGNLK